MKTKLYTFLLSSLLCTDALADNEPAEPASQRNEQRADARPLHSIHE